MASYIAEIEGMRGCMKKIVLIKGQSRYNVLRYFIDEVAEGLKRRQCEVEILDLLLGNKEDIITRLKAFRLSPPDAVISFNGMGRELVCEYLEVPFIGWMVDHPTIHHPRYIEWGAHDYAVCIDADHAKMVQRYYPNVGGAFVVPHGGSVVPEWIPYSNREIAVSFSGSFTSSQECLEKLQATLEPYEQQVAFTLIVKMQEKNMTLEQALEEFLTENKIPFTNEEFTNLCLHYLQVDYFIRAFYREDMLRTLVDNGVTVDVYGDNWECFVCKDREKLKLHPPLDYEESLVVLGNTKIALNVLPNFKQGGHERIFSSMLSGALCVTDANSYLKNEIWDGKEIVFYNRDRMQTVANAVTYYLENEDEADFIVQSAKEKAEKQYTWAHRAGELLERLTEAGVF